MQNFLTIIIAATVFMLIAEGFGFLAEKSVARFWKEKFSFELAPFALRVLTGLVIFGLFMLLLGSLNLLYPVVVVMASATVPLAAFLAFKRWRELYSVSLNYCLFGTLAFLVLTFLFFYRPVTAFDSVWYHLSIPKIFLQQHSSGYAGPLLWYSLQPNLDFFWNLWSLAVISDPAQASIVVNLTHLLIIACGVYAATRIGEKLFNFSRPVAFAAPILLGINSSSLMLFGSGYTDILAVGYGLAACLYSYSLVVKEKVSWSELTIACLLIVGLGSLKVFFILFSVLIFLFLAVGTWRSLPGSPRQRRNKLLIATAFIGLLCGLPWIIRSYLATGRILDPLGAPSITRQAYVEEGSKTSINHWTVHIFERFKKNIGSILSFDFTPLVFAGLVSVFTLRKYKKGVDLWALAIGGLLLIHFLSIVNVKRYLLPAAVLLVFLGIVLLSEISRRSSLFAKSLICFPILLYLGIVIYGGVESSKLQGGLYLRQDLSPEEFVATSQKGNIHSFYLGDSSLKPNDLRPDEPIFVMGVHNIYYISNPVYDPRIQIRDFQDKLTTPHDLAQLLKARGVRYLLVKGNTDMSAVCKEAFVVKSEDCKNSPEWAVVLRDKQQQAVWLKLN